MKFSVSFFLKMKSHQQYVLASVGKLLDTFESHFWFIESNVSCHTALIPKAL